MEWWNNGIVAFHAMICQGRKWRQNQRSFYASTAGVYLPEARHPIIPINCERSEPKFYLNPSIINDMLTAYDEGK
jgi:hypothetical protein